MIRRFFSLLLAFVVFFSAFHVRAQDVVLPDIPEAVLTPMEKEDKAPYQGVLLSPDAIANIIADYKTFDDKMKLQLEKATAEADASKKFAVSELTATCEADKKIISENVADAERRNKILIDEQKKLEKSQKNVLTWTIAGAAAGLAVGILGFFAVSSLMK